MRFGLKLVLINLLDAVLLNAAVVAALALRFDGRIPERFLDSYARGAVFYTLGMLAIFQLAGVNRSLWRYAGVPTLLLLVRTLAIGFAGVLIINLVPDAQVFPVSVVILSWIVATCLILSSRLFWKVVRTPSLRAVRKQGSRILIVGAGDVGAALAHELMRRDHGTGYPIGFVDDDPRKLGRRIETLPVLGTTFDIPRLIASEKVSEVLIAAPTAPSRLVRQVVATCQEAGVACRTVPGLSDFAAGKAAVGQLRDVQIEDLLGREPVQIDLAGISERVRGRTVLITGAGGSIGSELCRQLARFEPGRMVALDHCENRLCYLGLDLAENYPELPLTQVVGDIRDPRGVDELFRRHRPELVFHAAAHKHVHFLERAPREAVLNNILGTRTLAEAAMAHQVDTFVFISTDKAVNPSNVMGASKRACEIVLQSLAQRSPTTFVAVRFGNVLGSDGSVIPIFRRQMARGRPLTVTHPDVRRFFMTIPEASQLVIQAALYGTSGDVFVLDMGEQVRILDVAEQLIRLSGLRPWVDIPIRFVGLRPGEKIEEELLTDRERTRVTEHRKIYRLELEAADPGWVHEQVETLAVLAHEGEPEAIRAALATLVPEYRTFEPVPLPAEIAENRPAAVAIAPRITLGAPVTPTAGQRMFDVAASTLLLLTVGPLVALLAALHRLSGPAHLVLARQERIGCNQRRADRRLHAQGAPIDRRFSDRRVRALPGRPFTAHVLRFDREQRSALQGSIERFLERRHLDEIFQLGQVLRGSMSLVGPAARAVEDVEGEEGSLSPWLFTRRPGMISPGAVLARNDGPEGAAAELYDICYCRFGGPRLDWELFGALLARIVRGDRGRSVIWNVAVGPTGLATTAHGEGRH